MPTHVVPEWAFRQPDPLIYSQFWLQSQGLAVTWNNPDIHLELPSAPGVPVDVHALVPNTVYKVFARVWNGSSNAPVAQLPVEVSYLYFGIGGISVPITTTKVDLPVKGAIGTPAIAYVEWRTPKTPGHYCLQVRLVWPSDANPNNNLGQHNVDVKALNSPRATFQVPLRNAERDVIQLRLMMDAYELPPIEPCPPAGEEPMDSAEARRRTMMKHGSDQHPIPDGWTIDVGEFDKATEAIVLEPGESRDVSVTITAPDGFTGRRAFNLAGITGSGLLGGVTLVVTSDGT